MENYTYNDKWSNVGGCGLKHPFNADKKAECEATWIAKPKHADEQADLILANAAASKVNQPDTSWTAGQVTMVVGASLLGLTIMVLVIKKFAGKSKAK